MAKSSIDRMLKAARASNPDLWDRTEHVARIIAPEAFMDDWIASDARAQRLLSMKLKYQQAVACSKAQAVLAYLGVNTEADWIDILHRMAEDDAD